MAFTYRSSTSQGNASGGALTVTKPAGTVDGDLIIVVAYLETGTNTWSSVGTGFTRVVETPTAGTEFTVQMWWKWASSEPASWTWTPTSSAWRVVVAASYSGGAGTGSAIDVHGSNAGLAQNQANQTAPSVTTTAANDLLVYGYGNFSGTNMTATAGAATNLRKTLGGTAIADSNIATASATGTTEPNGGVGTEDFAAIHGAFFLTPAGGGTTYTKTGGGVSDFQGAGTKAVAWAPKTGGGVSDFQGAGTRNSIWVDDGIAVSDFQGAGSKAVAWAPKSGAGVSDLQGAGTRNSIWVDDGTAVSPFVGSGTRNSIWVDDGVGISDFQGSGVKTFIPAGGTTYTKDGGGISDFQGSGTKAVTWAPKTGGGVSDFQGSGTRAVDWAPKNGAGVSSFVGSGTRNSVWVDDGAGISPFVGSGVRVSVWNVSGTGISPFVGSGTYVYVSPTAFAAVLHVNTRSLSLGVNPDHSPTLHINKRPIALTYTKR